MKKIIGARAQVWSLECRFDLVASVSDYVVVDRVAIQVARGQTGAWVASVCNLAVADVYSNVRDAAVTEEDQVAGLQLALGDLL